MRWYLMIALCLALFACEESTDETTNDDDIPLCEDGYELLGDDCVPYCADGEELIGGACYEVCEEGEVWDEDNLCVPSCDDPWVYDPGFQTCVCKKGYERDGDTCIESVPSSYDYSVRVVNAEPRGGESFNVPNWSFEVFCSACVELVDVFEAPNSPGLYYFSGPDLVKSTVRLTLHGVHPCFDEFDKTITLSRGKTLQITVRPNDITCNNNYEMQCGHILDDFVYNIADEYLATEPNVDSCCARYRNTNQKVCLMCPDFDAYLCTPQEYVATVGDSCVCLGTDVDTRGIDIQDDEDTLPPAQTGYTRCNIDYNQDGKYNDLCLCNNFYLLTCDVDLDPSEETGYGDGPDHCRCDPISQ